MKAATFSLPKRTGTFADALAVMGLGRLLYTLSNEHPEIRDDGASYTVLWNGEGHDLEDLNYTAIHDDPGYLYMLLKPPDAAAPSDSAVINYGREREKLLAWRQRRDAINKVHPGKRTAEDEEELKNIAPMKVWYLYQNLNVLQGFNSYNALHAAIRASDTTAFAASVCGKLTALAEDRDSAKVATTFAPKVAAVQAFNPAVGKGTNRPKPDGPALAGLPGAFVDWFEEWLRFIGVHLAANALSVGDDIKFFVIVPADVDESLMQGIRDDFVSLRLAWSSIKIDILGALGLVRVLIDRSGLLEQATAGRSGSLFKRATRRTPRDVIAGLQTAYFTSLGSAKALTNTSFIGLPGWFPVESTDDWLPILDEHESILKALDEERSEQVTLLVRYRDFLSAGEQGLNALLAFLAGYAGYLMRARDRGQYTPQFTTSNLRRLFMSMSAANKPLKPILDDDGFKHVATAIRRATVSEQFTKARTGQQTYEIHYGLFQDLERKARFRDQFVGALTAFITDYNTENARIAERNARPGKEGPTESGGRRRPQVTTDDIERVVSLIDAYGSESVAMLLLAYGSAREPREAAPATDETTANVTLDEQS